jgi:hypothetical protein
MFSPCFQLILRTAVLFISLLLCSSSQLLWNSLTVSLYLKNEIGEVLF